MNRAPAVSGGTTSKRAGSMRFAMLQDTRVAPPAPASE